MPSFTAHLVERPNPTPDDIDHVDRCIEFWTAKSKPGDSDWYRDALWDADLVTAGPDSKEAQAEMQRRYDNWREATATPAVPVQPTVDSLQADLDSIDEQRRALLKRRLELEDQIATAKSSQPTRYWVAEGSGEWADPDNWNTEKDGSGEKGVPTTNDVVVITVDAEVVVPEGVAVEGRVVDEETK